LEHTSGHMSEDSLAYSSQWAMRLVPLTGKLMGTQWAAQLAWRLGHLQLRLSQLAAALAVTRTLEHSSELLLEATTPLGHALGRLLAQSIPWAIWLGHRLVLCLVHMWAMRMESALAKLRVNKLVMQLVSGLGLLLVPQWVRRWGRLTDCTTEARWETWTGDCLGWWLDSKWERLMGHTLER
jgi:hypothetical protein